MLRQCAAALAGLTVLVLGAGKAGAQTPAAEWTPPTNEMPAMPSMADLQGNWQSTFAQWFRGVDAVSGVSLAQVQATGETTRGGARARFVRFMAGPRQVAVWTDRNGDGRADMIELFRSGAVVVQLVDPTFGGHAHVLRLYDASGALARETRLQ
ncbi:MAG TPA: hypothetical protein VFE05_10320 [Longimicrobiaceae bacterium]|jgi:hypothetical protein|nr:hypothetical protein [Longimicrobiaceae bacterium]